MVTSGDVSVAGLCADVIGAFFLAESLVLRRRRDIENEALAFYGANPFVLVSSIKQSLYARVGFFFLAFGFTAQIVGQTDWFRAGTAVHLAEVVISTLALGACSFVATRAVGLRRGRRAVVRRARSVGDHLRERSETVAWGNMATTYGQVFGLERGSNESEQDYASRVADSFERWS